MYQQLQHSNDAKHPGYISQIVTEWGLQKNQ